LVRTNIEQRKRGRRHSGEWEIARRSEHLRMNWPAILYASLRNRLKASEQKAGQETKMAHNNPSRRHVHAKKSVRGIRKERNWRIEKPPWTDGKEKNGNLPCAKKG